MSHFGPQYDQLLADFNANTNAVAKHIDDLLAEVKAAQSAGDPLSDAQFAAFQSVSDHLKALGSDVQLPVPAPTAVAAAVVAALPAVPVTVDDHTAPESTPTL